MQNVKISVDSKNVMTITVDLNAPTTASVSGKTDVIASTRGNAKVGEEGAEVFVGLNVYRYHRR